MVMLIHELSHMIAAMCIGLKISHITFYPFGVNMKLKSKMIYSLSDEIILYISGPMCNAFFALTAIMLYKIYPIDVLKMFYVSNIVLFVANLLPALPLDGGFIVKRILIKICGHYKSNLIMKIVSVLVAVIMFMLGICALLVSGYNFSVLLFSMMIAGNVFIQKEKYDVDFVKELMFHTKKRTDRIKHIIANTTDDKELIKKFDINSYNVVYITDKSGKIEKILTEQQIINQLIDTNITSL